MDSLTMDYTLLLALFNRTLGYTGRVSSRGFVNLDHTADWAIRVRGTDLTDLLRQAAAGLLSLVDPSPGPIGPASARRIRLHAADRETLLVRWLQELCFLLETKREVPRRIALTISPGLRLEAEVEVVPAASPGRAIKAVTYHGLRVIQSGGGLEATVVFDV